MKEKTKTETPKEEKIYNDNAKYPAYKDYIWREGVPCRSEADMLLALRAVAACGVFNMGDEFTPERCDFEFKCWLKYNPGLGQVDRDRLLIEVSMAAQLMAQHKTKLEQPSPINLVGAHYDDGFNLRIDGNNSTREESTKTALADTVTISPGKVEVAITNECKSAVDDAKTTKTGKAIALKGIIDAEALKGADITTKGGIQTIVRQHMVRGSTEESIEADVLFIEAAWQLFSVKEILPQVYILIAQYETADNSLEENLAGYDPAKVAIYRQLKVAKREQSWGTVRESVALYDLHLELEKAGTVKVRTSKAGNAISIAKGQHYNQYLFMETGGEEAFKRLSLKEQVY